MLQLVRILLHQMINQMEHAEEPFFNHRHHFCLRLIRNLSTKRCDSYRKDEIVAEKVLTKSFPTHQTQTAIGALIDGCA